MVQAHRERLHVVDGGLSPRDEETCESSLSEPDFGTGSKRDPLATGNMVRVPAGCEVKAFVGEGSANVVVEIELPEGTPAATRRFFEGKL